MPAYIKETYLNRLPFHPSQLIDLVHSATRPEVSPNKLAEAVTLRMLVFPTAVLQRIAVVKEWARGLSFHELLLSSVDVLMNTHGRGKMTKYVAKVDEDTCSILADAYRQTIYGQQILPKTQIPVVYPLNVSKWTSDHSRQRLNLVESLVRMISAEEAVNSRVMQAYNTFLTARKAYDTRVWEELKTMAKRLGNSG